MSTPAKSSVPTPADSARNLPKKTRFRFARLVVLLSVLGAALMFEPRVFQFVVQHLVRFEMWRSGGSVRLARVEGSLLEPVVLVDSVWKLPTRNNVVARFEVRRLTAELEWRHLFARNSSRVFHSLTAAGVSGKVELVARKPDAKSERWKPSEIPGLRARWLPVPAGFDARDVDLVLSSGRDFVRIENARLRLHEFEPGIVKAGKLIVRQPWLTKTFSNVRGTTAWKESELVLAGVQLDAGVAIKSFSADLGKLVHGRFEERIALDAFGGQIVAEAELKPGNHPAHFEAHGTFSQIDIGRLASFLALSDAAGGTIKQGTFKFRGSPEEVGKSTTRVFLDAKNFQWESRQWDSLVLGATLIDRRLQVHDCVLHQGQNSLTVRGELLSPASGQKWWQSDFNWEINAKIGNLTELSTLLLPEFTYTAGRASVDGSVRGHAEKFQGHLVVGAKELRWRDAPIEELNATLKISGNELQVSHFNIFNDGDYVRGEGVVNILGPTQYWGMLRASVTDLGKYEALLQPPIVPEPLAGGGTIEWSGEGSAKGHSGKFFAQLQRLRSLGASAAKLHPINADLEGSYAAGGMVFSKFALSDDGSSFTANVAVGNKALALQGIRLMHRQQLWLEGDALLPLDVWKAWPNTSLDTLLDDSVQSKVTLTAYKLELGPASKLSGWNFPIDGIVNGVFSAEGPLGALKLGGKLAFEKVRIAVSGTELSDAECMLNFDGATMQVAKFAAQFPSGALSASGRIDFKNARDPELRLAVASERMTFRAFASASEPIELAPALTAAIELELEGPISGALVRGTAKVLDFHEGGNSTMSVSAFPITALDATALCGEAGGIALPSIFTWSSEPWSAWRFDLAVRDGALPPASALAACELHLGGTGAAPVLNGAASFRDLSVRAGELLLRNAHGTMSWRDGAPSIDASARGELHGYGFVAHIFGPLEKPIRTFDFTPPLTEPLLAAALAGRSRSRPTLDEVPRFGLGVPAALVPDVGVFEWHIADPATSGVSAHFNRERTIR